MNHDRWMTWQYLLDELDFDAQTDYESRLVAEPALQQLLADVVAEHQQLLLLDGSSLPTAMQLAGTSSSSPRTRGGYRSLAMWSAVAACVAIVSATYLLVSAAKQDQQVSQQPAASADDLAQLVSVWSNTVENDESDARLWDSSAWPSSAYAGGTVDEEGWDGSPDSSEDRGDDSLDEAISWRVIALSGMAESSGMN